MLVVIDRDNPEYLSIAGRHPLSHPLIGPLGHSLAHLFDGKIPPIGGAGIFDDDGTDHLRLRKFQGPLFERLFGRFPLTPEDLGKIVADILQVRFPGIAPAPVTPFPSTIALDRL